MLACLGDREQSGCVTNTRLAVRKCRGGPQGQEFYFAVRKVEDPVPDEDGDPVTTLVVDWLPGGPRSVQPTADPWAELKSAAAQLLRRVLMGILAEKGIEQPITPDGPAVRMVDLETVRAEFYAQWPAEGTVREKPKLAGRPAAVRWRQHRKLMSSGSGKPGERFGYGSLAGRPTRTTTMPRATRVLVLRTLRTQPVRKRVRSRVRTCFLQAVDIVDVLKHTGDRVGCVRVARLIGARTHVRSTPRSQIGCTQRPLCQTGSRRHLTETRSGERRTSLRGENKR